jgi:hypothetical protein
VRVHACRVCPGRTRPPRGRSALVLLQLEFCSTQSESSTVSSYNLNSTIACVSGCVLSVLCVIFVPADVVSTFAMPFLQTIANTVVQVTGVRVALSSKCFAKKESRVRLTPCAHPRVNSTLYDNLNGSGGDDGGGESDGWNSIGGDSIYNLMQSLIVFSNAEFFWFCDLRSCGYPQRFFFASTILSSLLCTGLEKIKVCHQEIRLGAFLVHLFFNYTYNHV